MNSNIELSNVISKASEMLGAQNKTALDQQKVETNMVAIDDDLEEEFNKNLNITIQDIEKVTTGNLAPDETKYDNDFLAKQSIAEGFDLDTFRALGMVKNADGKYDLSLYQNSIFSKHSLETRLKMIEMFFTVELIRVINASVHNHFKKHEKWINVIKWLNIILGLASVGVSLIGTEISDMLGITKYMPIITGGVIIATYIIGRFALIAGLNIDKFFTLQKQLTKLRFLITYMMLNNNYKLTDEEVDNKLEKIKTDLNVLNNLDMLPSNINNILDKITTKINEEKDILYNEISKHLASVDDLINKGCVRIEIKPNSEYNKPLFGTSLPDPTPTEPINPNPNPNPIRPEDMV